MSDDRLRELFGQVAVMSVDVPPAERAIDRGRKHRRDGLRAAGLAWTVMLAVGLGAPQAAVGLAGSSTRLGVLSARGYQAAAAASGHGRLLRHSASRSAMRAMTTTSPGPDKTATATGSGTAIGRSLPPSGRRRVRSSSRSGLVHQGHS